MNRPRIGISSCLAGERVRYDGTDRFQPATKFLATHLDFVRVCPEVETGMGVPREPVQLEGNPPRMIGVETRRDHTRIMRPYARRRVRSLGRGGLSGYLFKKGSPSCGPWKVKGYDGEGAITGENGVGLFAAAVRAAFPLMPVQDERGLDEPNGRESFLRRVFAYDCWRRWWSERYSHPRLVRFHRAHAPLLHASNPALSDALGSVLETAQGEAARTVLQRYGSRFLDAIPTGPAVDWPDTDAGDSPESPCPQCRTSAFGTLVA